MTEACIEHHESGIEVASKPKSVWLAQGYTEEQLAGCPRIVCPSLGECYSVPTKTETLKEIYTKAEQRIMEQEKALQGVKGKTAKAVEGGEEEELDVPAPAAVQGGAVRKGAGGGQATAKAVERKAAADARKAEAFNKKQQLLGGKAVGALQRGLGSLTGARKLLEKKRVAKLGHAGAAGRGHCEVECVAQGEH